MDTRSARSGVGFPRGCFRNKYGVGCQRDVRSLYAASLTILCLKRRSSGVALPTIWIVAPDYGELLLEAKEVDDSAIGLMLHGTAARTPALLAGGRWLSANR